MNWADWTILVILLVSSVISIYRGFVKEALSLVVWLLAISIALWFDDRLAPLMDGVSENPSVVHSLAFALLFLGTLIVGAMVNYLISQLVKMTGLTGTDRLLGMFFGMARGLVVVMAMLIWLPHFLPVDQDPWWQESRLIPTFLSFEGWAKQLASDAGDMLSRLLSSSGPLES
ncbi:CvpA family protein [Simiduia sp. 21SJ11W-1]|uniref:CvpA family protein n=1 Tax=Simiduia sp. 21SJ11W-1 TaxID=2909669 RepID=UPI00209EA476|nr:CvpA family protein [Simiduia sp. 21SJ11W-1]UTA49286.1 CvpA family protein [Simiduia sp. 21SJ11W-1]